MVLKKFLLVCCIISLPGMSLAMDKGWMLYNPMPGTASVTGGHVQQQEVVIPKTEDIAIEAQIKLSEERLGKVLDKIRDHLEASIKNWAASNTCDQAKVNASITKRFAEISEAHASCFKELNSNVGRQSTTIATLKSNAERDRQSIQDFSARLNAAMKNTDQIKDYLQKQINELCNSIAQLSKTIADFKTSVDGDTFHT